MRVYVIIILLISLTYSIKSQVIEGTYIYHNDGYADIVRNTDLILRLKKDKSFILTNINHYSYDTTIISKGSYYKSNDTIVLFSPIKDIQPTFSYEYKKLDQSDLKISILYKKNYGLMEFRKDYCFFVFDSNLNITRLAPKDTVPNYVDSKELIDHEMYVSYFFRIPVNCIYLTIMRRCDILSSAFQQSLTLDLKQLKNQSIILRNDYEFDNYSIDEKKNADVSTNRFLLKTDRLSSLQDMFGIGSITFLRKK